MLEDRTVPADFSNTTPITIPGSPNSVGPSTPYPSTINVSGLTGQQISKLQVVLNGLSHTSPDNIDAMLVAPNGTHIYLMSDVGGGADHPVSNVTLTIADAGVAFTTAQITTGTYKPTNIDQGDPDTIPGAPASPPVTTMAGFIGLDPNGARRVDEHVVGSLTFSPDGQRFVTGGQVVRFWDVGVLQELAAMTGEGGPAGHFARERLWAAAAVAPLTGGHEGSSVVSAAFAPDGNCLATGSIEGTVRLWDAPPLAPALTEPLESPTYLPPTDTYRILALQLTDTAKATLAVEERASRVDVTAVDGTAWHAQLVQSFDDLQEGASYTVRFRARADRPRPIHLYGIIGEPDFHGIGLDVFVSLSENWRDYEYKFQAKGLAASNMIQFHLGDQKGTVWIGDFTVTRSAK
jgi:WD40 repeat protein